MRCAILALAAALIVSAAPAHKAGEPRYQISGSPGAVTSLTISPVAGGRLVADNMLSNPATLQYERDAFTGSSRQKPGTCAYANAVRPFTRLTRYGADGKLQWRWDLAPRHEAIGLLNNGDAPCLSPNGTRLLVHIYDTAEEVDVAPPEMHMGSGVIAVGPKTYGFVKGRQETRAEAFASPRRTLPIGWRKGKPATLDYNTDADTYHPGRASTDYSGAPTDPLKADDGP